MKLANKTFISSTALTESTGFAAGIAVIDYFEKKVSKHLINIGKIVKKGWIKCAEKNQIKIEVGKIKTIPSFKFLFMEKIMKNLHLFYRSYAERKIPCNKYCLFKLQTQGKRYQKLS